jgi:two-component system cell cycle response regulator DivK
MSATLPKIMNDDSAHSGVDPEDAKKSESGTPDPDNMPLRRNSLLKGMKHSPGPAGERRADEASKSASETEAGERPAPASPRPGAETPPPARKPGSRHLEVEKKTQEQEAEKGKGEQAGPEPGADAPKSAARKPIDPAEAHVLVVEDNVPNFVLIARLLAYTGVERCEWKTSGWQVVEFADTLSRIDLILMDIRLPYEDGFQALGKVRAHPRFKDTLVVAVTAEASVGQMRRAKEAGFDGFLGKPLNPDKFPDQIRRVLNGQPVWEIH